MAVVVATFYQFVSLKDPSVIKQVLLPFCQAHALQGTVILATEGINGTVAGSRQAIDALRAWLMTDARFRHLEYKESLTQKSPFLRTRVLIKKEIVTLGVASLNLADNPALLRGEYVDPEAWDALITQPQVTLLDTRNDYETKIGSFNGAQDPQLKRFRDFPHFVAQHLKPDVEQKVALFCTGGIRCEKASAYLLQLGFKHVFQLKGGILNYLRTVAAQENQWWGECFVFDHRTSVDHELRKGSHGMCYGCRRPISVADCSSAKFIAGVSCPQCFDELSDLQKARFAERRRQVTLALNRNGHHLGPVTSPTD